MLLLRPWLLMQGAWHTVGAVCHLALAKVPSRQDLSLHVPLGVLRDHLSRAAIPVAQRQQLQ